MLLFTIGFIRYKGKGFHCLAYREDMRSRRFKLRRKRMINKEAAIAAIRTCKTREALENELTRYKICDVQEAIAILNECMYDPETFSSQEAISVEDELEFTKQIFLTGTWKLHEYYQRMKLGAGAGV